MVGLSTHDNLTPSCKLETLHYFLCHSGGSLKVELTPAVDSIKPGTVQVQAPPLLVCVGSIGARTSIPLRRRTPKEFDPRNCTGHRSLPNDTLQQDYVVEAPGLLWQRFLETALKYRYHTRRRGCR